MQDLELFQAQHEDVFVRLIKAFTIVTVNVKNNGG